MGDQGSFNSLNPKSRQAGISNRASPGRRPQGSLGPPSEAGPGRSHGIQRIVKTNERILPFLHNQDAPVNADIYAGKIGANTQRRQPVIPNIQEVFPGQASQPIYQNNQVYGTELTSVPRGYTGNTRNTVGFENDDIGSIAGNVEKAAASIYVEPLTYSKGKRRHESVERIILHKAEGVADPADYLDYEPYRPLKREDGHHIGISSADHTNDGDMLKKFASYLFQSDPIEYWCFRDLWEDTPSKITFKEKKILAMLMAEAKRTEALSMTEPIVDAKKPVKRRKTRNDAPERGNHGSETDSVGGKGKTKAIKNWKENFLKIPGNSRDKMPSHFPTYRPTVHAVCHAGESPTGPQDLTSRFIQAVERCADPNFRSALISRLKAIRNGNFLDMAVKDDSIVLSGSNELDNGEGESAEDLAVDRFDGKMPRSGVKEKAVASDQLTDGSNGANDAAPALSFTEVSMRQALSHNESSDFQALSFDEQSDFNHEWSSNPNYDQFEMLGYGQNASSRSTDPSFGYANLNDPELYNLETLDEDDSRNHVSPDFDEMFP